MNCRYIKSSKKSAGLKENLIAYMGTRDGVEFSPENKDQPATVKQNQLIFEIKNLLPEVLKSFEYEDYMAAPTKENATAFITSTLDANFDLLQNKKNLIEYMGKRPRVDTQGKTHGLFGIDDEVINIKEIMKKVAEHKGNIWTNVLSLRREDAERLGYNNQAAWKNLITSQKAVISKSLGISIQDLKVYAAFHNEGHHPHCHIAVYSKDATKGYLSNEGINQMKSGFARQIFKDDLYHIYEEKTYLRDNLKSLSKHTVHSIAERIKQGDKMFEKLEIQLIEISEKLNRHKGKFVYAFLNQELKKDIDTLVNDLSNESEIKELFTKWYDAKTVLIKIYQDDVPPMPLLSDCEEFKKIKNDIISEATKILLKGENRSNDVSAVEQEHTPQIKGVLSLLKSLSEVLQEDYSSLRMQKLDTEKKLLKKMAEKKVAQGQKL